MLEIRLDRPDGPVVGRAAVGTADKWGIAKVAVKDVPAGVHALVVTQAAGQSDVDWVSFR